MECGSKAAALEFERAAVADATALQGAFGTSIFKAEGVKGGNLGVWRRSSTRPSRRGAVIPRQSGERNDHEIFGHNVRHYAPLSG